MYIYLLIGPAVFAGVGLMVLFAPLAQRLAKTQFELNCNKMKSTDRRVAYTNEILQAMKVIAKLGHPCPRRGAAVGDDTICVELRQDEKHRVPRGVHE